MKLIGDMDEELGKICKEAVVDYFKFLALKHFPGGRGKPMNISKVRYLFIYVLVCVFTVTTPSLHYVWKNKNY
jgi:hypothetical protein